MKEHDWSIPVDGFINVPDELDMLVNKTVTQMRFYTISQIINEPECACRIVSLCQDYFTPEHKPVTLDDVMTVLLEWLASDDVFITDGQGGEKIDNAFMDCVKGSLADRMAKILPLK